MLIFSIATMCCGRCKPATGDVDTVMIPGVRCHPLDPSQLPEYSPSVLQQGMSCKTIFDCTVPFHLKHNFERSKFKAVDVKRFLPDFE